ncbi:hypothetical protein LMED105_16013 [Limnobacter sp. MED105]|nr:hypothetical protein LMED105_16013 [Limnobacter sp. MED105]
MITHPRTFQEIWRFAGVACTANSAVGLPVPHIQENRPV